MFFTEQWISMYSVRNNLLLKVIEVLFDSLSMTSLRRTRYVTTFRPFRDGERKV